RQAFAEHDGVRGHGARAFRQGDEVPLQDHDPGPRPPHLRDVDPAPAEVPLHAGGVHPQVAVVPPRTERRDREPPAPAGGISLVSSASQGRSRNRPEEGVAMKSPTVLGSCFIVLVASSGCMQLMAPDRPPQQLATTLANPAAQTGSLFYPL